MTEGLLKITAVLLFSFVLAFGIASESRAEGTSGIADLSIEQLMEIEVVSTASKFEQTVTEAPASVTVVTAEDIKRYGWRNTAEILNSFKGLYVRYDKTYRFLGIRGFNRPGDLNSRFLFMLNGHRITDNILESVPLANLIDVDIIERIEMIRGPGSSLYGTNAFFGVINIITKKGRNIGSLELSAEAESSASYRKRASYGNLFENGTDILISASQYGTKGKHRLYYREFDTSATNNGIAEDVDDGSTDNFFSRILFRDFSLQASHAATEKTDPTAALGMVFNDKSNKLKMQLGHLELKYDNTQNMEDRLGIMLRLSYGYNTVKASGRNKPYTFLPSMFVTYETHGAYLGGELRLLKNAGDHRLVGGLEYQNNLKQNQKAYSSTLSFLDDKRSSEVWAAYIQDEITISSLLLVNAGLRYDHYTTFGSSINPRVSLIHEPAYKTFLKLIYGKAFRAPSASEAYYGDDNIRRKINPDLKPEAIESYELIFEKYFRNNIRISLSAFYSNIDHLIDATTEPSSGLNIYINRGRVEVKGIELEAEKKWPGGYKGLVSYSCQDITDRATGKELSDSPRHLAKINLTAPLIKKVFAGIELHYRSATKTLKGDTNNAFLITNLTLSGDEIAKGLSVSASIYNLFDKHYFNSANPTQAQSAIEQDGRTYRVKATYRF